MSDDNYYCPGLGALSRLPPEIRSMIWEHLLPHPRPGLRCKELPLTLSRRIYREFAYLMYHRVYFVLGFIDKEYPSGKYITTPYLFGRQMEGYGTLSAGSHTRNELTPHNLPTCFSLEILVRPPKDLSHFILLWQRINFLANFMRECNDALNIGVYFTTEPEPRSSNATWYKQDGRRRRPPLIPDFWNTSKGGDLLTVLSLPFQSLPPRFNVAIQIFDPQGNPVNISTDLTPAQIETLIAAWNMELDLQLDTVDTELANHLRLERFEEWSIDYVREVIHYIKDTIPNMNLLLHGVEQYLPYTDHVSKQTIFLDALLERYLDMRYCHPLRFESLWDWPWHQIRGSERNASRVEDLQQQIRWVMKQQWRMRYKNKGIPCMQDGRCRISEASDHKNFPHLDDVRQVLRDAFYSFEATRFVAELGKECPDNQKCRSQKKWKLEGPITGAGNFSDKKRKYFFRRFDQSIVSGDIEDTCSASVDGEGSQRQPSER